VAHLILRMGVQKTAPASHVSAAACNRK